jgi:hypothetical protein
LKRRDLIDERPKLIGELVAGTAFERVMFKLYNSSHHEAIRRGGR